MSTIRYEPNRAFRRFHNEVNRLLNDRTNAVPSNSTWRPAVDIEEDAERFVITADVPGVDSDAIEITMEDGVLSIRGERSGHDAQSESGLRRVERLSGRFERRFSLPDTADADAITAHSAQGVLRVEIPKKASVKPRRIAVN